MSITKIEPINDGREGKVTSDESTGATTTTSSKAWRVYTSNNTDNEHDLFALAVAGTEVTGYTLPKIGTAYPGNAASKCIAVSCRPVSDATKKHWVYVAEYSDKVAICENPLDDPAQTEWSTETFQTVVYQDIDGNGIVNSAGDPFDPPAEKDDSRWSSVTRKNVAASVPDWIFAYQDGVNSDSFTIDGSTITAGWAKVSAIHLSGTQERNDVSYRVLTATIHYRGEGEGIGSGSGSYGSGSGDDEIEPWHLSILDAGFREVYQGTGSASGSSASSCDDNLVNIKDCNNEEPTAPVPLDGAGSALDSPTPETSVFLQFQIYHEKAFQLIESMFT